MLLRVLVQERAEFEDVETSSRGKEEENRELEEGAEAADQQSKLGASDFLLSRFLPVPPALSHFAAPTLSRISYDVFVTSFPGRNRVKGSRANESSPAARGSSENSGRKKRSLENAASGEGRAMEHAFADDGSDQGRGKKKERMAVMGRECGARGKKEAQSMKRDIRCGRNEERVPVLP
ncbi:hypothetical protein HPB50_003334 [Hyalomma asiaticum]|uniref:Uncharacterized protein n=1 Tax=Hyalomma asiaticum TaxID=266040 RepID=A0ACB7SKI4_HYAAI|nr:hypothetical protein HPB50_003334 [Hyalomma asiaticum]